MLIDDLRDGRTPYGIPDKTIETVLSFIFVFGQRVLKVYKHRPTFYGDMSEPGFRERFYEDDMAWNSTVAPDVYLALKEFNSPADHAIEMRAIDDSRSLTRLLPEGKLTPIEIAAIASSLVSKLNELSKMRQDHLKAAGKKYSYRGYVRDLEAWIKNLHPHIPDTHTNAIITVLDQIIDHSNYLEKLTLDQLSISIDANSDNLLFIDGKPSYIDIMPPKKEWRICDPQFCITRLAVDAEVLGNSELAQVVYTVRERAYGKLPALLSLAYQLHAATIQWAYRTELKQTDIAEKYRAFIIELPSKI